MCRCRAEWPQCALRRKSYRHLEGHCDKIMTKCRRGLFPIDEVEFAVTYQDLCEFASQESVEYRRSVAEMNLKRKHSLGATTIYFRARKVSSWTSSTFLKRCDTDRYKIQYPTNVTLTLRFIVEFDNDEDYPPFVHYMVRVSSQCLHSRI